MTRFNACGRERGKGWIVSMANAEGERFEESTKNGKRLNGRKERESPGNTEKNYIFNALHNNTMKFNENSISNA